MKKIIMMIILVLAVLSLTSCGNRQLFDTTWVFTKAVCKMPDGTVEEFPIKSWKDYEDSDMIQIETSYHSFLTHSSNCFLKTK